MHTLQRAPTVVESRFTGLPDVAHGGYLAGVMATMLGAAGAEIRLRRPVRPGRALDLARAGDDAVELRDGDALLARAARTELSLDVPSPVTLGEAEAASKNFLGRHRHLFPGCFVCGTDRRVDDGLRIYPGRVDGRRLVAAPWVPPGEGLVPDELVWAAFDCSQLWSLIAHAPADTNDRVVTAALAARIERPAVAGEPHVVVAWPIGGDERTRVAGAALFGPDGELYAAGRQAAALATWGVPLSPSRWIPEVNDNPRRQQ